MGGASCILGKRDSISVDNRPGEVAHVIVVAVLQRADGNSSGGILYGGRVVDGYWINELSDRSCGIREGTSIPTGAWCGSAHVRPASGSAVRSRPLGGYSGQRVGSGQGDVSSAGAAIKAGRVIVVVDQPGFAADRNDGVIRHREERTGRAAAVSGDCELVADADGQRAQVTS